MVGRIRAFWSLDDIIKGGGRRLLSSPLLIVEAVEPMLEADRLRV